MCVICATGGKLQLSGMAAAPQFSSAFVASGATASRSIPQPWSETVLLQKTKAVFWETTHKAVSVMNTTSAPVKQMTYTFESSQPSDLWQGFTGWTEFSEAQKTSIRDALANFSEVANISFVEVGQQEADPDLNFGLGNLPTYVAGLGGFSYAISGTQKTWDGFAFFDKNLSLTTQDDKSIILHEIGHALGLKHSGNYDASGSKPKGAVLSAQEDNNLLSVMSYNANPLNGLYSDNLMLLDIAALQQRWGANMNHRTGDDVYTGPRGGVIDVIWDAGGIDTISAEGRTDNVTIDLREGGFSSIGATANLAIAYKAKIENATGGDGNDILTGNDLANTLRGGAGNDTLSGGQGRDFLFGGEGSDSFIFNTRPTSASADRIMDFSSEFDTIMLSRAVFSGLSANKAITEAQFKAYDGGRMVLDRSDRIVYDRSTGDLYFDADGSGRSAAIKFATVDPYTVLTTADFFVF
jgi:Ca2+-binding RTX toxin-like protein